MSLDLSVGQMFPCCAQGNCLAYKLVLATKNQNGWPGFTPPYVNRYLAKQVTIVTKRAYDGSLYGTASQGWVTDRATGLISSADGMNNANADFPYGEQLSNDANDSWQVSESEFVHTVNNGYFIYTTTVTLSNQYTFGQLDADVDALLASVSVLGMQWNTLVVAQGADQTVPLGQYFDGFGLQDTLLPPTAAQIGYPDFAVPYLGYQLQVPGSNQLPALNAAAWATYAYGAVSSQNYFPNGYGKLISYLIVGGKYVRTDAVVDFNQNLVSKVITNGQSTCKDVLTVRPVPLSPGATNTYTVVDKAGLFTNPPHT